MHRNNENSSTIYNHPLAPNRYEGIAALTGFTCIVAGAAVPSAQTRAGLVTSGISSLGAALANYFGRKDRFLPMSEMALLGASAACAIYGVAKATAKNPSQHAEAVFPLVIGAIQAAALTGNIISRRKKEAYRARINHTLPVTTPQAQGGQER